MFQLLRTPYLHQAPGAGRIRNGDEHLMADALNVADIIPSLANLIFSSTLNGTIAIINRKRYMCLRIHVGSVCPIYFFFSILHIFCNFFKFVLGDLCLGEITQENDDDRNHHRSSSWDHTRSCGEQGSVTSLLIIADVHFSPAQQSAVLANTKTNTHTRRHKDKHTHAQTQTNTTTRRKKHKHTQHVQTCRSHLSKSMEYSQKKATGKNRKYVFAFSCSVVSCFILPPPPPLASAAIKVSASASAQIHDVQQLQLKSSSSPTYAAVAAAAVAPQQNCSCFDFKEMQHLPPTHI